MDEQRESSANKRIKIDSKEHEPQAHEEQTPTSQFEEAIRKGDVTEVTKLLPEVAITLQHIKYAEGSPDVQNALIQGRDITANSLFFNIANVQPESFEDFVNALMQRCSLNPETVKRGCIAALHEAAFRNNKDVATVLLNYDASILDGEDKYGNTALHSACENSNIEVATFLTTMGSDVNKKNNDGNTALHMGVNSEPLCQILLSKKAQTDIVNNNGDTALFRAIRFRTNIALLLKSSNPESRDKLGKSVLEVAIESKNQLAVTSLLAYNDLKLDTKNVLGESLLLVAAKAGDADLFSQLLATNKFTLTQVNDIGLNALHYALTASSKPILELLRPHLTDLTLLDPIGRNPLAYINDITILRRYVDLTNQDALLSKDVFGLNAIDWLSLVIKEADLQSFLNEQNINVLPKPRFTMLSLIEQHIKAHPEVFCLLNKVVDSDLTKLLNTIYFTNPSYKEMLADKISNQLSQCISDPFLKPCLDLQLRIIDNDYPQERTLRKLEQLGDFYQNLVQITDPVVLKKLIVENESAFHRNDQLKSLLHIAAQDNNVLLTTVLLDSGMDVNASDHLGKTPLDYCSENSPIKELLSAAGGVTGKEKQEHNYKRQHLTILSPHGKDLNNFPAKADDMTVNGIYLCQQHVYAAIDSPDLVPIILHEWGHRLVMAFNVDLEKPLQKFFEIFQSKKYQTSKDPIEADCIATFQGLLNYPPSLHVEEFFVRSIQMITKHGQSAVTFLKKYLGEDIEQRLYDIIQLKHIKDEVVTSSQEASSSSMQINETNQSKAACTHDVKRIPFFKHASLDSDQDLDTDQEDNPTPRPGGLG